MKKTRITQHQPTEHSPTRIFATLAFSPPSWHTQAHICRRLLSFHMMCLRSMTPTTWVELSLSDQTTTNMFLLMMLTRSQIFRQTYPLNCTTPLSATHCISHYSLFAQALIIYRTAIFFDTIYYVTPMMHPSRYKASIQLPRDRQPPACLQYAVMATAASIDLVHAAMTGPLYKQARRLAEADETRVRASIE